jgi:hypothetical protein
VGDRSIQEVCVEALDFLMDADTADKMVYPNEIIGYFYEILDIEHEREDDMR